MNNEEGLNRLICAYCEYNSENGCEQPENKSCADGIAEWLKKEYEKQGMGTPEL